MSRTDYCNTLIASLPASIIVPLQRVQNAAARLVLQLGPCDYITQGLHHLHWLLITERVFYKLCVLMHDADNGRSPAYISDNVTACHSALQWPGLRLASTTDYIKPCLSTKFGERAYSFAGPNAWNNLPYELRRITNVNTFKEHLKTHFLLTFLTSFVFSLLFCCVTLYCMTAVFTCTM